MATKYVYLFREGDASMRDLLGGKGAGLAEMTRSGAPVPPGFTITTEACNAYSDSGSSSPTACGSRCSTALKDVEQQTGKKFGDPANPLLVSVRSGAKFSMPGMMDTVLNLGLNKRNPRGPGQADRQPALCRRCLSPLRAAVRQDRAGRRRREARACDGRGQGPRPAPGYRPAARRSWPISPSASSRSSSEDKGVDFPDDPMEQLREAIAAVFRSWNGRRARRLSPPQQDRRRPRHRRERPDDGLRQHGQRLAPPALPSRRNPSTGENQLYGEYLVNAQGEDVVAGVRTPRPISEMERDMPEVYQPVRRHRAPARAALQRCAGHGVYRRARQAVHAPDPHRQAHRRRGR